MQEFAGFQIFTGVWVNWSRGRLVGSTLTLSTGHGGLLSSFLAIFISLTGIAFWRITSFTLHQIRAGKASSDGLHHQQQLIFRNTGTASGAFWQMLQLPKFWRNNANSPWLRTLPVALLALINVVVFAVAAIFSSEVTKAPGKGILIQSPNCGRLEFDSLDNGYTGVLQAAYNTVVLNGTTEAAAYTRNCYGDDANGLRCNRYVQTKIPWRTNVNASCPFDNELCFFGQSGAMEMDTGPIDSHHALGINVPKEYRITYRKVATCSPIKTSRKYRSVWNDTDPDHIAYGDTYDRFFFGPLSPSINYTYEYNRHAIVENYPYTLKSTFCSGPCNETWSPVPALNRTNSDISLFFLASNSLSYGAPVSDPFFSANIPFSYPDVAKNNTNDTVYESDDYVTVLGCIDQHQYCNPNNNKCTPLMGTENILNEIAKLGMNSRQFAVVARIAPQQLILSTYYSVSGRGSGALRASETVYELSQIGLPNNQWMIEASSWFAITVAKLQEIPITWATGPPYVPDGSKLVRASLPEDIQMCKSQIILSPGGTMSFSVLGIAIILIVGIFLMLLSLWLDSITGYVRRKLHYNDYKRVQWGLDGMFQLHRLAYEAAGQGAWTGGAGAIPVTRRGDLMGVPTFHANSSHPTLHMPGQQEDPAQFSEQTTPGQFSDPSPGYGGQKTPFFSAAPVYSAVHNPANVPTYAPTHAPPYHHT